MLRIIRSLGFLLAVVIAGLASTASAKTCNLIYDLERLEARVGLLVDRLQPQDATSAISIALQDVFSRSQSLGDTPFRSPDLAEAAAQYSADIAAIRRQLELRGPVATARTMMGAQHRNILRQMVAISHDACAFENNAADRDIAQNSTGNGGFGSFTAFDAPMVLSGVLALMLLPGLGYLGWRQHQLRSERRVRYVCDHMVTVKSGLKTTEMQMLDVSAMGAKLRLNDDQSLSGKVRVKIDGRSMSASIAWQNAHFVGLLFKRPMSLRFTKSLSFGEAKPKFVPKTAA